MRIAIAILGAAAVLGCKGNARTPEPDPVSSAFQRPPAPGAAEADSSAPLPFELPAASRAAPVKSRGPLDRARSEKLASLEVRGWRKEVRYLDEKSLEVRYRTEAGPALAVEIAASPCFDCMPPELPRWKAKEAALRYLLPPELRERRDTVFEVGEARLAGAAVIYTYQLAHEPGADAGAGAGAAKPGPPAASSSAYAAYHNDGINQLRVIASFAGGPAATREALIEHAPRELLARIALAFLGAYAHAW